MEWTTMLFSLPNKANAIFAESLGRPLHPEERKLVECIGIMIVFVCLVVVYFAIVATQDSDRT